MKEYLYTFPDNPAPFDITVYILTVLIGLFFILLAVKNFKNDEHMVSEFERWNYPVWFRKTVAFWQLICGLCLAAFPISYIFSALLIVLMTGAVYTHLRHDPPLTSLGAFVFLFLLSYIFWYLKPVILVHQ